MRSLAGQPAAFAVGAGRAVFPDVQRLTVELELDTSERLHAGVPVVRGEARVDFELSSAGYPVLDLLHTPTEVLLDGCPLAPELYREVMLPDGSSRVRLVEQELSPGPHTLLVRYEVEHTKLPPRVVETAMSADALASSQRDKRAVRAQGGRVNALLQLNDYEPTGRGFFERYAPSSFEYDQHETTLRLRLRGAEAGHRVFSNAARVTWTSDVEVELDFPAHFATSSPFVHLVHESIARSVSGSYTSVDGRSVPITVYQDERSRDDLESVLAHAQRELAELEGTLGPYPHPALVVLYDRDDAMEYAGAVHAYGTSLRHELAHQWFGRGVAPADGQAGWIDEALTYWIEDGYRRESLVGRPLTPPLPLASDLTHQRRTLPDHAKQGARLIAGLDGLLAPDGGLRPLLRELYAEYRGRTLSVPEFVQFLTAHTRRERHAELRRYLHAWGYDQHGQALRTAPRVER